MMKLHYHPEEIELAEWNRLVEESPVSTWFQTPEAYHFYSSLSDIWELFIIAIDQDHRLKGLIIGTLQKDGGRIKQYFSRRAIILGGPLLDTSITASELSCLLQGLAKYLAHKAIYLETRNFNDYSTWRDTFEQNGFEYEPHLNFVVSCENWEETEQRIGKHRRRYIRQSLREGASIIDNPTVGQVKAYYALLESLYKTKVKKPLFPLRFFENLFHCPSSRFNLIAYNDEIIGGSVCVCLKGRSVYEWFACGQDGVYKGIHPSSLTKMAGMRFAHDHGYPLFDMMGAGKPDEKYGVRDFKAEFGGQLVEYGRFRHVNNALLFNVGKLGIKLLKRI